MLFRALLLVTMSEGALYAQIAGLRKLMSMLAKIPLVWAPNRVLCL